MKLPCASRSTYISTSSPHFFFFDDTATTEIYTLSLHDALPISDALQLRDVDERHRPARLRATRRSEEHTSERQSRVDLVCRLLLEKKKDVRGKKDRVKKMKIKKKDGECV